MKKTKFIEAQIVFAIKQSETGTAIKEVCRKMGISEATFYNWKKKYGGLGVTELRRLKQLEEENSKLKQIVADLSLDKQMLQDVLKKSFENSTAKNLGHRSDGRLPGLYSTRLCDHFVVSFGLVLSGASSRRQAGTPADQRNCRDAGAVWIQPDLCITSPGGMER
jgi:putative transposase